MYINNVLSLWRECIYMDENKNEIKTIFPFIHSLAGENRAKSKGVIYDDY
jgi:hypothetical protein